MRPTPLYLCHIKHHPVVKKCTDRQVQFIEKKKFYTEQQKSLIDDAFLQMTKHNTKNGTYFSAYPNYRFFFL